MTKKLASIIFLPRYQLSVGLGGWGLWIIVLHPFDSSGAFYAFSAFANEYVWGAVFVIAGIVSFAVMYRERYRPYNIRRHRIKLAAHSLVSISWFVIAVFVAVANARSTGTYTYMFLAVLSTLSLIDISGIMPRLTEILTTWLCMAINTVKNARGI